MSEESEICQMMSHPCELNSEFDSRLTELTRPTTDGRLILTVFSPV